MIGNVFGKVILDMSRLVFDIDVMRDRSPWVCGMVVRPEFRGMQVGRRLLEALRPVPEWHCRARVDRVMHAGREQEVRTSSHTNHKPRGRGLV